MVKNFSTKHSIIALNVEPTTTIAEVRNMMIDKAIQLYWPNDTRPSFAIEVVPGRTWPIIHYGGIVMDTEPQENTLEYYGIDWACTLHNMYFLATPDEEEKLNMEWKRQEEGEKDCSSHHNA